MTPPKEWQLLSKRVVFPDRWRPVEEWNMRLPNGKEVSYPIRISKDVAVVCGVTRDHDILLLHQFYISLQKKVPTLVAGVVDGGA